MKPASTALLLLLVVVTAALIWCPPLSSSLWLDELDTFFASKDGVVTAIGRTVAVHPQCSMLYNAIMALVIEWIGQSEATLRLPSLLASVLAAVYLYRIGSRLVDPEAGLLAALFFVALDDVAFAAVDARAYAFATAACIASTYYLLRLLDLPATDHNDAGASSSERPDRRRDAVAYALSAATMLHFHYLYAFALVPHAMVVVYLVGRCELTASRRDLMTAAGVGFVALLPTIGPFLDALDARHTLSYAPDPTVGNLLAVWARPEIVMSILPVLLLASGRRSISTRFELPALGSASWLLMVAWAVLPPACVFVVAELSSVSMFISRYYLAAAPGLALTVALCLRGIEPARLRAACAVAYAVLSIVMHSRDAHVVEDWRALAASVGEQVDASTPILIDSGFVEGARADWLRLPADDDRRGLLVAPAAYYPLGGEVMPLPYALSAETGAYLEQEIVPALTGVERFVCIGRGKRATWWRPWFDARYASTGYVVRELHRSAILNAVIYERPSPSERGGASQ